MHHRRGRLALILGFGLLVAVVCGSPGSAMAEEGTVTCPICSRANEESAAYPTKAVATLGRGAANTLLGWTELIRQPAQEAKDGGNVLNGIGKGVGQGLMRTFAGIGEVLTFWTPKVNDRYLHFSKDCPVCMGEAPSAD